MKKEKPTKELQYDSLGNILLKLLVVILLFFTGILQAQTGDKIQRKSISGVVVDSTGVPVTGVNVVITGTNKGTLTDVNGKYNIDVTSDSKSLTFTFIGMESQEINIGAQSRIDVTMIESAIGLEEVVVIGYGTQKKVTVTGAVSEIKTVDIAKNAVSDISNSISGRIPGVITVQSNGEPGDDAAQLYIRGRATFNDNSPLILVDGVERQFNYIDPNNIESMSVLKDASATAVYGVRGANGVIIITTKRGIESAPKFTYTGYYGVQNPIRIPSTLNSYDYARLYNEALINDDPGAEPVYSADDLQKYKDHSDPYGHPDVDWNRAMMRENAPIQRHSLSMTGGAKTFKYFASLGHLNQQGNIPNNSFVTNDYRLNLDADISKTTRISANISGILSERLYPGLTGQYKVLVANLRPNVCPVKWENGLWGTGYNGGNSVAANYESGYYRYLNNSFQNSVTIEQKLDFITNGLAAKILGAYDVAFNRNKQWLTPFETYSRTAEGEYESTLYGGENPSLYEYSGESKSTAFEVYLTYNRIFGRNSISALFLYTQSAFYSDNFDAGRSDYSSSAIDQLFAGPALNPTNDGSAYESGREGYVGRITYGFEDKYLVEANFGYNGSENFPQENRFGFFPSAAVGWIISKEDFLSSLKFINFMKIRLSYGEVGNDKIGGRRFLYQQPFYYGGGYVFGGNNGLPVQSIYAGGLANEDVTWEKAKKTNIGLDSRFFNSILEFNLDVFYEKRDNILWQRNASVPLTFGAELPVENIAKVDNKGFELVLNHRYKIGDFEYSIGGNFTFAKNKVVFQDEAENTPEWQKNTGRPIGQYFGLVSEGLYMTQEQLENNPKLLTVDPRLGDIRYKDINDDGIISDLDYTAIGYSRTPQIMYGINLSAKYKGFDLSALLQGVARSSLMFSEEVEMEFIYGSGALTNILGRWTPDGSNVNPSYPRLSLNRNEYKKESSTYWLKDGAYWRLKNIQLGYTLPQGWLKRINIENVRMYINCTNLYTHAKFKDYDPESPGGSNYYYPQSKANTIGLSVTF